MCSFGFFGHGLKRHCVGLKQPLRRQVAMTPATRAFFPGSGKNIAPIVVCPWIRSWDLTDESMPVGDIERIFQQCGFARTGLTVYPLLFRHVQTQQIVRYWTQTSMTTLPFSEQDPWMLVLCRNRLSSEPPTSWFERCSTILCDNTTYYGGWSLPECKVMTMVVDRFLPENDESRTSEMILAHTVLAYRPPWK